MTWYVRRTLTDILTFLMYIDKRFSTFILTSGNFYGKYLYSLDMMFSSGLRYYYHFSEKSGLLDQNIGQFLQVNAGVNPGSISSKGVNYPMLVYVSPNWGFQIGLSRMWNLSFMAGVIVGSHLPDGNIGLGAGPNLEFRVARLIGKSSK